MSNVYDILYVRPRLHKKLKKPQEALAKAIVASGRMRLDADDETNFTRLLIPHERINATFTRREMSEPALYANVRQRLFEALSSRHNAKEAEALTGQYLDKVKADLKKRQVVKPKVELMMARALVSCNALPVITLIHLEGAEIFISYGHSVGDVMDIATWQEVGNSNGLQAFGPGQNAVYVSCGGHPFLDDHERNHSGDGFPALARFMVIAAQETGHNGDMIRDENGTWVGRHSAISWSYAPSPKAGAGRKSDIARSERWFRDCQRFGLNRIAEWERHLKFYQDQKLYNWRRGLAWLKARIAWQMFKLFLRARGMRALCTLQRERYPATLLRTCLRDMLFNLAPQADAYRRSSPQAEDAILCIEAVARVPQQAVKWGQKATRGCMAALYAIYYEDIVPSCEAAVSRLKR